MLKLLEEVRIKPYDDRNPHKELTVWTDGATIGVGHLILEREWDKYKNGISEDEVETLLSKDLEKFEKAVNKRIKVPPEQHQFDALVILAFNIGVGEKGFINSSVVKLLNGESGSNFNTLKDAWLAWKHSRGKESSGLFTRRESEYRLYTQGIYQTKKE